MPDYSFARMLIDDSQQSNSLESLTLHQLSNLSENLFMTIYIIMIA